jgi:hypothetical protein
MFKKKPILQYESYLEFYPNIVEPAKGHVPKWYKEIDLWKNNEVFSIETRFNKTVKHCTSLLDSLTIGYMLVLPYDFYVKNNNGIPYIACKGNDAFTPKAQIQDDYPSLVPEGHNPLMFTWKFSAAISIPLGYSFLLTHPINRHELPFTTVSGVVDGGFVTNPIGSLPFYIKDGFEGVIPQGTPIAQIIPFRQENWSSKIANGLVNIGKKHGEQSKAVLSGWYKKTFWTRKNYN